MKLGTAELLRELSNPARLDILRTLALQSWSEDEVARRAEVSVREAALHVKRLEDAGLVEPEPTGEYRASSFGRMALSLLPGLDFLAAHWDYFKEHELTLLPDLFVRRVGDLRESESSQGTVQNLQRAEHMLQRAEGDIRVLANEVLMDSVPVVREKIAQGARFRIVVDETYRPPPEFEPAHRELWRRIPRIPAATVVAGDEAILVFPDLKLKMDYAAAFVSSEAPFRDWCMGLVDHYWDRGHRLD